MTLKEYKENAMSSDAKFREEYEALASHYEVVKNIIAARVSQNLTQADLAKRVNTRQSNISRFESGNSNPSLAFLQKIAGALGKKLEITLR